MAQDFFDLYVPGYSGNGTDVMRTLLIVFLLVVVSACAPKSQVTDQALSNKEVQVTLNPDALLAEFIGQSPQGTSQSMQTQRFGHARVTVGRSYHSALNIPCKEAFIQGNVHTRTAACKDAQQGWILAPDVLGDGAL